MPRRQFFSRHHIQSCVLALVAGAISLRAQERPQLAPLPVNPLPRPEGDLQLLLPGEDLKLVPATPLLPEPDALFKPKRPPVEIRPVLPPLPAAFGVSDAMASRLKIFVKGFRFNGNSVFNKKTLEKTVERFKNREVTAAEIEQARQELTLLYVNAGY